MVRPAQTARSERTREALRRAAVVRFLAQGVEDTSAEQIAADAGVSLRTFYRHFASKHDLLFADYDAGLHWFRAALAARAPEESIIESVQSAIMASPYDGWAVTEIAAMRARELDDELGVVDLGGEGIDALVARALGLPPAHCGPAGYATPNAAGRLGGTPNAAGGLGRSEAEDDGDAAGEEREELLHDARKAAKVLLIFPGQGSQCVRMGEGLYRTEPRFRAHVDRMSAVLAPLLGFDLRAKLYPAAAAEGAADFGAVFDEPTVAQPAIFVTELVLGRTLLELGVAASHGDVGGALPVVRVLELQPEEERQMSRMGNGPLQALLQAVGQGRAARAWIDLLQVEDLEVALG